MSMSPPPPSSAATTTTTNGLTRLIRTTLSYDTNIMLAAIIALLLVILFVLLLHLYTRWFLLQARRRSRNSSVTVPRVLQSRFNQRFTIIETSNSDHSSTKLGLPFSIIAQLPLFVYKVHDFELELDCAICLSVFEDEEIGRKLPGCGHAFHVECIDMWLNSHSTCPICRTTIDHNRKIEITDSDHNQEDISELRSEIVTTFNNQTVEPRETADNSSLLSSPSLTGELQSGNKLLTTSSSSRSGGKVHPSSIVNDDDSDV
ncbi:hypothetical protein QVD17_02819 [Tagetes erecta]|uniref:RING-type domain-containing protein n=1 Tax=Tagetes erecta TaxID=13708 RepID=A0AAD8LA58_TARER|nr:hypothetical protein QVD17_02819 [Tagetes erecta]